LACLERRSYGEPALLNSGVEPGEGGQMPGKKYLTNAKTTKEGFTGKERDKHSGLDYFGARYYDPALGKWLSVDPLADHYFSWSTYNYSMNDPINKYDPDGRWVNFAIGAFVEAATDYASQVIVNVAENGGRITTDAFTNVDKGSILTSFVSGAAGVGIASKVSQAVKAVKAVQKIANASKTGSKVVSGVANAIGDASASVAGSVIQGNEISVQSVGADMIGGAVGRKVAKQANSAAKNTREGKVVVDAADRAKRKAAKNPRQSRTDNINELDQKVANLGNSTVKGAVGSNATSKTINKLNEKEEDK
jgi:RHS repeat-associated protein